MPLHLSLRNAMQPLNTARPREKVLWYAQLPWATYLLNCPGGYNQEAAQLHSCLSHQQVGVRSDGIGIGGREYVIDTKE